MLRNSILQKQAVLTLSDFKMDNILKKHIVCQTQLFQNHYLDIVLSIHVLPTLQSPSKITFIAMSYDVPFALVELDLESLWFSLSFCEHSRVKDANNVSLLLIERKTLGFIGCLVEYTLFLSATLFLLFCDWPEPL